MPDSSKSALKCSQGVNQRKDCIRRRSSTGRMLVVLSESKSSCHLLKPEEIGFRVAGAFFFFAYAVISLCICSR